MTPFAYNRATDIQGALREHGAGEAATSSPAARTCSI